MSRRNQKRIENELKDLINDRANNNKCGECGADYPTWASVNLGVFLCGRCASLHRMLGDDISIVKSLTLDKWNEDDLESIASIGNKKAKKFWNPKNEPFPFDDDDKDEIFQFLRQKYIFGKFRYEPPTAHDYNLSNPNSRSSSRVSTRDRFSRPSSSRHVPKLRHVDTPEIQRLKYRKLEPKLQDRGFNNMDDNYEALHLAKGDISLAIDILSTSGPASTDSYEKKPPLPRRPGTSTSTVSAPSTSQPTNSATDWWNNNEQALGINEPQSGNASSGLIEPPQQYLDPATGVIYVDPVQQQLYEQQQFHLQQQQTSTQSLPAFGQQTGATVAYGQQFGQGQGLATQQTGLNKNQLLSLYNQPISQQQSQTQFTQGQFTQPLPQQVTQAQYQQQHQLQNQFTQFGQPPIQQQFTQHPYGQQQFPGQF